MKENKPDFYNNLDKVYIRIWELLKIGLLDRDAPFHIPVFICDHDSYADGRMVVLRGINKKDKNLWFHSDIRSNKIKTLKTNPVASLLFYDKKEKVQLRIIGKTKINYQNNITKKSWNKTVHMSRQCYLGGRAPGSKALSHTSGLTEEIENYEYSIEESEIGYKNFCVIETFINSIEWLYLAAKGHRRALFEFKGSSTKKKWLVP